MGAAIIAGIRRKFSVRVCEVDTRRRRFLKSKFRVSAGDLESVMKSSRVIILTVKPQSFEKLLKNIRDLDIKNKLFISIAAGITTQYIEKKLGKTAKAEAMLSSASHDLLKLGQITQRCHSLTPVGAQFYRRRRADR